MLNVTKAALDRLSRKLARKRATEEMAMRFVRRTGGWKLRVDRAHPSDTVYAHQGRTVLLLDTTVSEAMANMTLDVVVDEEAGTRLKLR